MRLQEIMTKAVRSVPQARPAEDAWQLMRAEHVRHLVVMDAGVMVGILSERDLGSSRGSALRRHRSVAEFMTPEVVTATPQTTVREAANLMRGHIIGCLPVLERGKVVGIVTTTDLLNLVGKGAEKPVAKSRRWVLKDRGPRLHSEDGAQQKARGAQRNKPSRST